MDILYSVSSLFALHMAQGSCVSVNSLNGVFLITSLSDQIL
nr:MAG TPA: hypothetical protein [Bacteriophage sp.]